MVIVVDDFDVVDVFLKEMYGKEFILWLDELMGYVCLCCIVNYLICMCLIDSVGCLEFSLIKF